MYINRIFHVKDSRTESKIYTNSFIFGAVAIVAVVVVAFYFSVSFFFIARTPWARMRKSCCVNRGEMPEHRKAEKYVNCNYCVLCLNVSIYIVYNYSRNGRRGTTNNERTNVTNERRKKIVTILIVHTKHFAFHLQVLNWPKNKWFISFLQSPFQYNSTQSGRFSVRFYD